MATSIGELIFSPAAGRVKALDFSSQTGELLPAVIKIPDFIDPIYCLISATTLRLQVAYQLNDSIGGDIFLMVFGETSIPITLSGLIFEDPCGATPVAGNIQIQPDDINIAGSSGIDLLRDWWARANLANNQQPITITVSRKQPIRAFLTELSIGMQDAEQRIWQISMGLVGIPPRRQQFQERFGTATPPVIPPATPPTSPNPNPTPAQPPTVPPTTPPAAGLNSTTGIFGGSRTITPAFNINGDPVNPIPVASNASGFDDANSPLRGRI